MSYVITLRDFTPIARYDGVPWTKAKIEESSSSDGPWTDLGTQTFTGDVDPTNPSARSFTVSNANLPNGWYRVTFQDALNAMQLPTSPVKNVQSETLAYQPTVSEVAAKLRARTKDKYGTEVGTFNADTRPTGQQVNELIQAATDDVIGELDTDIPEEAWPTVRKLIAIRAAMEIELSFFPEQVGKDRSAYQFYKDLFDEGLERAQQAVEREAFELETGAEYPELAAVYNFPVSTDWDRVAW